MHVVMIAASRFPLKEPFAGGLESLTWHLCRGLRANGIRVSVFAGRGSDPRLGVRELRTRPLDLSAAARQDVAMPPAVWLSEHHAYLQVMLGCSDAVTSTSSTTTASTTCRWRWRRSAAPPW